MINYAMMITERERNFISEKRQIKAKFKMIEAAMAEYQLELENYSDRRRRYRDIVEHMEIAGFLVK